MSCSVLATAFAGLVYERMTALIPRYIARRRDRRHMEMLLAQRRVEIRSPVNLPKRLPVQKIDDPFLYLTALRLTGFRCFNEAQVEFRFPGEDSNLRHPNVNLLLGNNGSGKSSVLRAAAMASLGPILDSSGFVPYRLVRQDSESCRIEAAFAFGTRKGATPLSAEVSITRRGDFEILKTPAEAGPWTDLFDESSANFFVVGYGVNRRVSDIGSADPAIERGRRRRRYERVLSLFNDSAALIPFGSWLPMAEEVRQAEVADALADLLPTGTGFTRQYAGEQPVFRRNGVEVPFLALSDGLKSYIGWLGDLFYQLNAVTPPWTEMRDMGGIVMVDEIDLLLHPRWQRAVIGTVSDMFPNMQFIFTTHSPLVTGTLHASNIVLAEECSEKGSSTLQRFTADVYGLNAEQVLVSSYFDLASTRAPDAQIAIEELARRAVEGDAADKRRYLEALNRSITSSDNAK